ncbi:MAG: hydrogenase nickel incorporation protein HypB [Candidatus Lokiarchaeota archaeon]|nr:hydrogenase nickel incorporation protein HypB [Candidatus Lokiarchaeota archaeon]
MSKKGKISRIIELNEDLIRNNDIIAAHNNKLFSEKKIKSFEIVGAIGAGKTSILESIINQLSKKEDILVINGDIATRIDANRIEKYGVRTIQINTGRECALNAYHISQVLKHVNLDRYKYIFIENVGNLICPSDFILGADKRIVVVSITEGEWVIKKHPLLFKMSDIAIINKIDLLDILDIDIENMIDDAKKINPNIKIFITSTKTETNIEELLTNLIEEKIH